MDISEAPLLPLVRGKGSSQSNIIGRSSKIFRNIPTL